MLFSNTKRIVYKNPPLEYVVCQLRFPTIFEISKEDPTGFQEKLRVKFPLYEIQQQTGISIQMGAPGLTTPPIVADPSSLKNYGFLSLDRKMHVNLANNMIAITTELETYKSWDNFRELLDNTISYFLEEFKPVIFNRIGLRFLNIFSKKEYGCTNLRWRDIIENSMLGVLADPDVKDDEIEVNNYSTLIPLGSKHKVVLNAGLGKKTPNDCTESETVYVIDCDYFCDQQTQINDYSEVMETLHGYSTKFIHYFVRPEFKKYLEESK